MNLPDLIDYALAAGQCILAVLLWHQAEPRMREARGPLQATCMLALGFTLAMSFPLTFMRPITDEPQHWQRAVRDGLLLLHALCLYRHAMRVGARFREGTDVR